MHLKKLREVAGGGIVTIPFTIHPTEGGLYVGVMIPRHLVVLLANPDECYWGVPSGFVSSPAEWHADMRATLEKLGYKVNRPFKITGGKVPSLIPLDTLREGVDFYGLPVTAAPQTMKSGKDRKTDEIAFVSVDRVCDSSDLLLSAATHYLMKYLEKHSVASVMADNVPNL
jgi:hypothetical protein